MGASIQYFPEMDNGWGGKKCNIGEVSSFTHPSDGECHHSEISRR